VRPLYGVAAVVDQAVAVQALVVDLPVAVL